MNSPLSPATRRALIARHKKERDRYVRDRIKAILAYDEGYSYSDIARLLLIDDETVRRYINHYLSTGDIGRDQRGGSESYLNIQQTQALVNHLKTKTYMTAHSIIAYVKTTYQVNYTISGITKWLQTQSFRYKKPEGVPAKLDPKKQADFIEAYKVLKAKLPDNEVMCFADSVHPEHQTRPSHGWIYKGETKTVAMTGRQKRMNIIGAIELSELTVTYRYTHKVNTDSIKAFLKQLAQRYADQQVIHLIWDNAGYHCSRAVQDFAEQHRIQLHYLPPYSPNFNPIERLWKIMHQYTTRNRYHEKFADFTEAIKHFFRHISKKKRILKKRINDNFQILDKPNFAF